MWPGGPIMMMVRIMMIAVAIKPIVLHSQFLSFATKEQNNTPRNKVNLTLTLLHCSGPMKRYKVMESSRKSSANNFPQLW